MRQLLRTVASPAGISKEIELENKEEEKYNGNKGLRQYLAYTRNTRNTRKGNGWQRGGLIPQLNSGVTRLSMIQIMGDNTVIDSNTG